MNTESILTCFRQFKFLTQVEYFAKAIPYAKGMAFARWPIFKIVSCLQYLVFLPGLFAQNISDKVAKSILTCFRQFKILGQIEYFAKAIAHAKATWPIFKIVSFLEYLVFFRAFFCTESFC